VVFFSLLFEFWRIKIWGEIFLTGLDPSLWKFLDPRLHTYGETGPRFKWSHLKDRCPRPIAGFEPRSTTCCTYKCKTTSTKFFRNAFFMKNVQSIFNWFRRNQITRTSKIFISAKGLCLSLFLLVRIRARIGPPHPLVCRKRWLNGTVLLMRAEKPRSRVTAGVTR
jgi:hypothetical protein